MVYRLTLVVAITVNAILSYSFERIVVWHVSQWWKGRKDRKKALKQMAEIEKQRELLEEEDDRKRGLSSINESGQIDYVNRDTENFKIETIAKSPP